VKRIVCSFGAEMGKESRVNKREMKRKGIFGIGSLLMKGHYIKYREVWS